MRILVDIHEGDLEAFNELFGSLADDKAGAP